MALPIILASGSPQRQNILRAAGVVFSALAADIDEKAVAAGVPLEQRALTIATAKAEKIRLLHPDSRIIAADTFSVFGSEILEKPVDLTDARRMLRLVSGRTIMSHTGLFCDDPRQGITLRTTVLVQITFRKLSTAEIERYVTTQPVTTWSAAFSAAYDVGMALIARTEGSLTALTHGIPMELVLNFLSETEGSV